MGGWESEDECEAAVAGVFPKKAQDREREKRNRKALGPCEPIL